MHAEVKEELEYLLCCNSAIECADDEQELMREKDLISEALNMILQDAGDKLTDAHKVAVKAELYAHASKDVISESKTMRRRWNMLCARLGLLDRYDPNAGYSRRMKTCTVDGIKYEAAI